MKRRFTRLFIVFACFIQALVANAHPLDVSNTTLTLYENSIEWVTYVHPVELDRILVNNTQLTPTEITVDSYYALIGVLSQYLKDTISVNSALEKCELSNFSFTEDLMIDEIFSSGFPIGYHIQCSWPLADPEVSIRFLLEVPLQTNKLNIYKSTWKGDFEKIDYRVLNKKKESLTISLSEKKTIIDTDKDWLSDEDEILYGTKIDNLDSDSDGYSDFVEIQNSWNPLTKELSPWQKPYSNAVSWEAIILAKRQDNSLAQDTTVWWWVRFAQVLRNIRIFIDEKGSFGGFWILMFSIFILWFIHALGPGHSKWILVSQILDKNIGFLKGIAYSGVFSLVHILDIILVVLISRYLFQYVDPSMYLGTIQKYSVFLILIIGVYLLFSSIRSYKMQDAAIKKIDTKVPSRYKHLFLAVITGLTPCAFGWSIFLMLLAVNRGDLTLPLLIALGMGIFSCLAIIACITIFWKKKVILFAPKIGSISPIISSSFIILIGFSLFIQLF